MLPPGYSGNQSGDWLAMWFAVLVACAFLLGACGGSDKPSTGRSGGAEADAQLCATDDREEIPLRAPATSRRSRRS